MSSPPTRPSILLFFLASLVLPLVGADEKSYVFKAGDGVSLKVYNEPDLATETRILKSGEVSFPLIGKVILEGLSVTEGAAKIYELYNKDYLVKPKLTLTVSEYAPEYVDVLGAVETAGRVKLPAMGKLDLASVFAMVGGFTEEADRNAITVMSAAGEVKRYSGTQAAEAALQRVILAAGDRVIVGKSAYIGRTFTVLGEVKKEGPLAFPLNGKLDLVTAIALAGGLTDLANQKKVTVRRGKETVPIDYQALSRTGRSFVMQPGDIVTVARRIF